VTGVPRFHPNENVNPSVAAALLRMEIDVTVTRAVGLQGCSDQEQIEFCRREGRILLTHDVDFLVFANQDNNHPGIIYCQLGTRTIGEIVNTVILIYEVLTPQEMAGNVEFI
jgi:predicted nuclease of predicted toxin-antitoxin system